MTDSVAPPRISIITPVYKTDPEVLKACLLSCYRQLDQNFVHIVIDNGSNSAEITEILQEYQGFARNAVVLSSEVPLGIAGGSQRAFDAVETEYVAFLDHDDELYPDAIAECNDYLTRDPETDLLYSDWDKIDLDGQVVGHFPKPAWSPERLRGNMYLIHFLVIRSRLIERAGGFSDEFEGSQDHDLVLRISELNPRAANIPRSLYRWRAAPGSVMAESGAKPYATENGRKAIAAHCARIGLDTTVTHSESNGFYRHERRPTNPHTVSIIIPTASRRALIAGRTRYPILHVIKSVASHRLDMEIEVICVTQPGASEEWVPEALELLGSRLKIVEDPNTDFNFSRKVNLGAVSSSGDMLLFLNDDVEVVSDNWLNDLVAIAEQDDVGAVGALLLFEDGRAQHAGHLYVDGAAGHSYYGKAPGEQGFGDFLVDHEVSGVTGACLMQRREIFEQVGGFSEYFASNYNDVDYCLKIRELGYRIVLCANTALIHYESLTRQPTPASEEDIRAIRDRWHHRMLTDPYVRVP